MGSKTGILMQMSLRGDMDSLNMAQAPDGESAYHLKVETHMATGGAAHDLDHGPASSISHLPAIKKETVSRSRHQHLPAEGGRYGESAQLSNSGENYYSHERIATMRHANASGLHTTNTTGPPTKIGHESLAALRLSSQDPSSQQL